jgi:Protein of unknown function (DUF1622)
MRRAVDQLIELIQFAGVAVAFVGVLVTVVRAAVTSLSGNRGRITDVGLDLARIVLLGIDLLLVSAILRVALSVDEVSFQRLATVAALRIGLTLLIAFEDAFRADAVKSSARGIWNRRALGYGPRPGADRRPAAPAAERKPAPAPAAAAAERLTGNVWADRARLGRD